MPTFSVERFSDVIPEIGELLPGHFDEVGRKSIGLDVDWDKYKAMDAAGLIHLCTARMGGELVGYSVDFVVDYLHRKGAVTATNDAFYISPSHRKGLLGLRFLRFVADSLKARGVTVSFISVTKERDFSSLLTRLGYEQIETVFERVL